ncbi:MAG: hypothetical protein JNM27_22250 [Leptospirales bacterium]|nr:hypothetical protein [Leptospirales bacterium]
MEHQASQNRVAPWVEKHFPYQLSLVLLFAGVALPACDQGPAVLGGGMSSFPASSAYLVESNVSCETISASGMVEYRRPSSKSRSEQRDRFYGSLKGTHRVFAFTAGWRYLPGPRTSYLVDESMIQALGPSARTTSSVFLQPLPELYLPGIFGIQGSNKPGIYWRDPQDRMFVGVHPQSGLSAFSMALAKGFPFSLFADVVRIRFGNALSPWTAEGAASFRVGNSIAIPPSPEREVSGSPVTIGIELERQRRWDLNQNNELDLKRKGRSGLVSLFASREIFFSETAGQDLGRNRMRFAGGGLRLSSAEIPLGLILRGRAYESRVYGGSLRHTDSSGAIGAIIGRESLGLDLLYEARRSGAPRGEVTFQWRTSYFETAVTAFARATNSKYPSTFTFMRTTPQYANGARFFMEESAALQFKIRAKFLYLYLSTAQTKKSSKQFAMLEGRLEF